MKNTETVYSIPETRRQNVILYVRLVLELTVFSIESVRLHE